MFRQQILSLEYFLWEVPPFLRTSLFFPMLIYVCERGLDTCKSFVDFSDNIQKPLRKLAFFFKGKSKKLKDFHQNKQPVKIIQRIFSEEEMWHTIFK